MKYNDNGTYKDIYVKALDTLPVGAEVDYDGSTVPTGWEEVPNMSGTNENGSWTKFSNGMMIITQSVEISNKPVNYSWGYWYMSTDAINSPDYPVSFISIPNISVIFASSTASAIAMYSDVPSTTNPGAIRLVRGSSSAGVSGTLYITSIGRWK